MKNMDQLESAGKIDRLEDGVFREIFLHQADEVNEGNEEDSFLFGRTDFAENGWEYQQEEALIELSTIAMVMTQLSEEQIGYNDIITRYKAEGKLDEAYELSLNGIESLFGKYGFTVERMEHAAMTELTEMLESEGKVICFTDGWELEGFDDPPLRGVRTNGMVELIAVDLSDPMDMKAYYNNVGVPDGCLKQCKWSDFQDAWKASSKLMLYISRGHIS